MIDIALPCLVLYQIICDVFIMYISSFKLHVSILRLGFLSDNHPCKYNSIYYFILKAFILFNICTYVQVIISFRGTEQVKFKDILTDINMIQVHQRSSVRIWQQEIKFNNVEKHFLQMLFES